MFQLFVDFFSIIGILILAGLSLGILLLIAQAMFNPTKFDEKGGQAELGIGAGHIILFGLVSFLSSTALTYKIFFQLAT